MKGRDLESCTRGEMVEVVSQYPHSQEEATSTIACSIKICEGYVYWEEVEVELEASTPLFLPPRPVPAHVFPSYLAACIRALLAR